MSSPLANATGSVRRTPLVTGQRLNLIESPPIGPDPGNPIVYREIPKFPGYKLGSDGSVWACFAVGDTEPPIYTWRWELPDYRPGRGREVVIKNNRGSQLRISIDRLLEAIFPPEIPVPLSRPDVPPDRPGGRTKLDASKVAELRRLKAEGWSYERLQKYFGVAKSTVHYALATGWKFVLPEDEQPLDQANTVPLGGRHSKVTPGMIAAIKRHRAEGWTLSKLAQHFGIAIITIRKALGSQGPAETSVIESPSGEDAAAFSDQLLSATAKALNSPA